MDTCRLPSIRADTAIAALTPSPLITLIDRISLRMDTCRLLATRADTAMAALTPSPLINRIILRILASLMTATGLSTATTLRSGKGTPVSTDTQRTVTGAERREMTGNSSVTRRIDPAGVTPSSAYMTLSRTHLDRGISTELATGEKFAYDRVIMTRLRDGLNEHTCWHINEARDTLENGVVGLLDDL